MKTLLPCCSCVTSRLSRVRHLDDSRVLVDAPYQAGPLRQAQPERVHRVNPSSACCIRPRAAA